MAGTYKPRPRPKAGVFKLTPAEKAIIDKKPIASKYTPKPRPKPGVFKLTPAEQAIINKRPTSSKKITPKPKPRTSR